MDTRGSDFTEAVASDFTEIQLEISGMTCTACSANIERRLRSFEGVTASVNFATKKARVTLPTMLAATRPAADAAPPAADAAPQAARTGR